MAGQVPIFIADFGIAESRLAIYIDGAAFHVGNNLRRDKFIRTRLQEANPPWQVIELTAKDLSSGKEVIENIRKIISK